MSTIYESVDKLIGYGLKKGLIEYLDIYYVRNMYYDILHLDGAEAKIFDYIHANEEIGVATLDKGSKMAGNAGAKDEDSLELILKEILDYAVKEGIIEDGNASRDLFDTKLMGVITPRPSTLIRKVADLYAVSPKIATDFYYEFSKNTDYIRTYRVCKDLKWTTDTKYGTIDITINLSKPEKDPKAIAAAKLMKPSGYPKCLLCKENEGYAGTLSHPARHNHRIIPVTLDNERWYVQYSPYVYYNEHCIAFNSSHVPMTINAGTFRKLLDFVERFPHYFLGSNADLPIVGGSILTHEHYQGGCYEFAMERAKIEKEISFEGFEDVNAGIVHWPMSVIRINSKNKDSLVRLANKILVKWRSYSDVNVDVYAFSVKGKPEQECNIVLPADGSLPEIQSECDIELHNTITAIARTRDGSYELDLVLRNNRTSEEYPLGIFHPHDKLHHIKKENIGLIEVMGLAVLPARLKNELKKVESVLLGETAWDEDTEKHKEWAIEISMKNKITKENVYEIVNEEVGKVFAEVLEDAGVFKETVEGRDAFLRFTDSVNK